MNIFIITVLLVETSLTAVLSSPQCVTSCQLSQTGYHAHCGSCREYVRCYSGQTKVLRCINDKEWDRERTLCVDAPSPTCHTSSESSSENTDDNAATLSTTYKVQSQQPMTMTDNATTRSTTNKVQSQQPMTMTDNATTLSTTNKVQSQQPMTMTNPILTHADTTQSIRRHTRTIMPSPKPSTTQKTTTQKTTSGATKTTRIPSDKITSNVYTAEDASGDIVEDVNSPAAVQCTPEPEQWLSLNCQYIVVLSALAGLLPLAPILICCKLFCWSRCCKKKTHSSATQTGLYLPTENVYSDIDYNSRYTVPIRGTPNPNPYQRMLSPDYLEPVNSQVNNYIEITGEQKSENDYTEDKHKKLSIKRNGKGGKSALEGVDDQGYLEPVRREENVYLELCGYTYLNLQKETVKQEVDKTLAPLVVNMCHKYKTCPDEYKAIQEKVQSLVNELNGDKSTLQVVIDEMYESRKNQKL